jgi:ParB family transcriptional regulator, chromosome partitioning protein
MTRKALGKGLSALIREPESSESAAKLAEFISVDLIDPSPFQPRKMFDEAELRELADSLRAKGVIQPVLVRPSGDRYQLVAGERRWRAAKLATLEAIPAIVRPLDDRDALEFALTENLLRDDLGPLEAARAYRSLQDRFGLSQEEIASRLGINRVTVTNTLRLLRLPPTIQRMIEQNQLTAGHARALLAIEDEPLQLRLAERAVRRGLSVRDIERLATSSPDGYTREESPKTGSNRVDPNVRNAIVELERRLGTRVKISGGGRRGTIQISYFSAEDLDRIYGTIMG